MLGDEPARPVGLAVAARALDEPERRRRARGLGALVAAGIEVMTGVFSGVVAAAVAAKPTEDPVPLPARAETKARGRAHA